jgi:hypothetical protein
LRVVRKSKFKTPNYWKIAAKSAANSFALNSGPLAQSFIDLGNAEMQTAQQLSYIENYTANRERIVNNFLNAPAEQNGNNFANFGAFQLASTNSDYTNFNANNQALAFRNSSPTQYSLYNAGAVDASSLIQTTFLKIMFTPFKFKLHSI